jgi:hypothetical protein
MDAISEKQHAHQLIDRLPEAEISTAVRFLEFMLLDPAARTLANAPVDDEPITEEEEGAVAEAREWFRHNPGIPFEQVVAELGFTLEGVQNQRDPA